MADRGRTRWQWRSSEANGRAQVSEGKFELFYDCVSDARSRGFEPRFDGKIIVCGKAAQAA
jgi:hypothetical protein